jgi:hypothetical protein
LAANPEVLTAFDLLAAETATDESGIIQELMARGYPHLQAELLVLLIPLACGRVVIATLPNTPRVMPDSVMFPDAPGKVLVPLMAIPDYVAALEMAQSAFGTAGPARERVRRVARWGSELRALQAASEAGQDLARSQIPPTMFLGIANIPGFEQWHQELQTNVRSERRRTKTKKWWQFWK